MTHDDIDPFLLMAADEGWLCDRREFAFLLNYYTQGAFAAVGDDGEVQGYITSIAHRLSGWIGNLIVGKEKRRKGIGSMLMERCLETLASSGVRTVWLTASSSGAPLYERLGFRAIDRIFRWRVNGGLLASSNGCPPESAILGLLQLDRYGWGDDRSGLCREKIRHGTLLTGHGAALVIQEIDHACTLIGPWAAHLPKSAGGLLEAAMKMRLDTGATFVDLPAGNAQACTLLERNGFKHCSETVLMYLGDKPDFRPHAIYALASSGSIG